VTRATELLGEEVKRAYFESAELSGKNEEKELASDILVGIGKNAQQTLASLGAAKVIEVWQIDVAKS
jgi:salicylate hydroxylase